MSWTAPCAHGQRKQQLASPPRSSDLRHKAPSGGLELFQDFGWWWGAGSQHQAPAQRADGYLVGLGEGAPRQQYASRACNCKTFVQRSRFIAKFAMHSSAGQKRGSKLATMRHCHTSGSMQANAWINSTTSCGNHGWRLRMSNCSGNMAHVAHPVPKDAN